MKKVTAFIGCDPGASGALCLLKVPDNQPIEIFFLDHDKSTNLEKHQWLTEAAETLNVKMSMLEDVRSLFGMSAKSNFSFGGAYYTAKLLLELQTSFGLDLVKAKAWQKAVGIPPKKPKEKRAPAELKKLVANQCKQLYPECVIHTPRGRLLDGRSDALMIAHHCMLKHK